MHLCTMCEWNALHFTKRQFCRVIDWMALKWPGPTVHQYTLWCVQYCMIMQRTHSNDYSISISGISSIVHYNMLYFNSLHCTAHDSVLGFYVLHCTAIYIALQYIILHCTALHKTAVCWAGSTFTLIQACQSLTVILLQPTVTEKMLWQDLYTLYI